MCKTRTPHKHAEVIKAWADGAEIEIFSEIFNKWTCAGKNPLWYLDRRFRVKPEPKPDVVLYGNLTSLKYHEQRESDGKKYYSTHGMALTYEKTSADSIRVTYDGETGRLKAVELLLDYIETFVA